MPKLKIVARTDMGQGAAQAIEDACALGAIMPLGTAPERVPSRLVLWQQCRKDRAAKIVLHTRHRSRKADGSQGPPQTRKCLAREFYMYLFMC